MCCIYFNFILTTGEISVILVPLSQKGKLRYKKDEVPRLTQLGEAALGQRQSRALGLPSPSFHHWDILSRPLSHTQQSLQAHY